jgi:hypothetical protein
METLTLSAADMEASNVESGFSMKYASVQL